MGTNALAVMVLTVTFGLFSQTAFAQFTKTIQVTPGVPVIATTTWYYLSCTTSGGLGSYTINVAPTHGTVTFADVSGPLPGCPTGSPSLPAVQSYYTWTDTTDSATSDFFELYYYLNGQLALVLDVTATLSTSCSSSAGAAQNAAINRTAMPNGAGIVTTAAAALTASRVSTQSVLANGVCTASETVVANINGGADESTPASNNVTANFPLGSNFTVALLDPNGNLIDADYALSNPTITGNVPSTTLFPISGVFQYSDPIAGRGSFHAAHNGTVTLTVTPKDSSTGAIPATITIVVSNPASLGTDHPEVDGLIYPVANATGIPPDFIKAQMAQESGSQFDPLAYRYEPLSRWVGDYGAVSRGQDLRASTFASYRFATIKDSEDGALSQGALVDDDDLATRAKFPCCGASPTALQIIENYDDVNNWTNQPGAWARYVRLQSDDFTAQTSLAASFGYMQITYSTAITTMHWAGIAGLKNPTLLYDTALDLAGGAGSLNIANQYLEKLFFQANPDESVAPSLQFTGSDDLIDAFNPAWQRYNGSPAYPAKVSDRIPTYPPINAGSIF